MRCTSGLVLLVSMGLVQPVMAAPEDDEDSGVRYVTPGQEEDERPEDEDEEDDEDEQGQEEEEPEEPDREVEPDPGDDEQEDFDEDEGEPLPKDRLPLEGEALRPGLPYVDRDLVQPRSSPGGRASAQFGFASIDDDFFLEMSIGAVFTPGRWRIAPRLPLRIRLVDEAPETDAIIRMEDWDEASDWARLLAFVQYGAWGDPLLFRYGELTGVTLGHGSLVNRYFNTIDIDHYQGGVYVYADAGFIGGEAILNDVFDPEVLVGRGFVRPFDGADDLALPLRGLKIGVTAGADFTAPVAVDVGDDGLFATPENEPIVLADRALPMFALDLEVPLVSSPHVDVVPYVDLASLELDSFGLHVGAMVNLRFTPKSTLRVRAEYRFIGEDHVPGYVSPFYEIERYAYLGGDPKLGQLDALHADDGLGEPHHGVHLETDLRIARLLNWTFIFTSNGRDRHNDLLTRLRLPYLGPVRLTLFFARLGFENPGDLFAADRTIGGVSARVRFGDFFVRGRFLYEWRLRTGEDGKNGFQTVLNWDLGVGVLIDL